MRSTRSPTVLTTRLIAQLSFSTPTSAEQYDQVFSREKLLAEVQQHLPGFRADKVHQVNHHLAHAASAFYTSGWDECLVRGH